MHILLYSLLLLGLGLQSPVIAPSYQKKVDRELRKLFPEAAVSLEPVMLREEQLPSPDFSLHKISSASGPVGYLLINRVNACPEGGCSNPDQNVSGRFDHYFYMAVYDLNYRILRIRIIDYQSQHGFEIMAVSWLKQFAGFSGCELRFEKEIDGIAGATVSARALVDEVNENCRFLSLLDAI